MTQNEKGPHGLGVPISEALEPLGEAASSRRQRVSDEQTHNQLSADEACVKKQVVHGETAPNTRKNTPRSALASTVPGLARLVRFQDAVFTTFKATRA